MDKSEITGQEKNPAEGMNVWSLRPADHSPKGVLSNVVGLCVIVKPGPQGAVAPWKKKKEAHCVLLK
jgi:hypothetical protein